MDTSHLNPLIRKLESITDLSSAERKAILDLPLTVKSLAADQDIVSDGERPSACCLVLDGFVCRYKLLASGRRQIMSFHIAGDIPDLQSLHLEIMDHSLGTLVPSRVAFISHRSLLGLCADFPTIANAFWRDTLIDAAMFREWMVGIGRRSAHGRIAHMLCELLVRYRAVGLAEDHSCEMPLTQAEIGDALGLSAVHVNRVLQELRGAGLIVLNNGSLKIQDWKALKATGEFDPTYLHLDGDVADAAIG